MINTTSEFIKAIYNNEQTKETISRIQTLRHKCLSR